MKGELWKRDEKKKKKGDGLLKVKKDGRRI